MKNKVLCLSSRILEYIVYILSIPFFFITCLLYNLIDWLCWLRRDMNSEAPVASDFNFPTSHKLDFEPLEPGEFLSTPECITNGDIYGLIHGWISLSSRTVCKHAIACDLLEMLELKGEKIDGNFKRLVEAVVDCDDDIILNILENHYGIKKSGAV